MVLLCGLLHLFLFVSNAKADPDLWGLVKRDNDAFIYEPPLTQVENASKRNCHKKPRGRQGWRGKAERCPPSLTGRRSRRGFLPQFATNYAQLRATPANSDDFGKRPRSLYSCGFKRESLQKKEATLTGLASPVSGRQRRPPARTTFEFAYGDRQINWRP